MCVPVRLPAVSVAAAGTPGKAESAGEPGEAAAAVHRQQPRCSDAQLLSLHPLEQQQPYFYYPMHGQMLGRCVNKTLCQTPHILHNTGTKHVKISWFFLQYQGQ